MWRTACAGLGIVSLSFLAGCGANRAEVDKLKQELADARAELIASRTKQPAGNLPDARKKRTEEEKRQLARAHVQNIGKAVMAYRAATGDWPQNLQQLTLPDPAHGLKATLTPESLIDPWGQWYQDVPPPAPHNGMTGPDVFAVFPNDGTMIGNWREK
jgi:hypothetical protein